MDEPVDFTTGRVDFALGALYWIKSEVSTYPVVIRVISTNQNHVKGTCCYLVGDHVAIPSENPQSFSKSGIHSIRRYSARGGPGVWILKPQPKIEAGNFITLVPAIGNNDNNTIDMCVRRSSSQVASGPSKITWNTGTITLSEDYHVSLPHWIITQINGRQVE